MLEKTVFYLLLFCLPFQTRKIFFQWGGSFNEWTSAYLYLTDILVLALLALWLWRKRESRFLENGLKLNWRQPGLWLVCFLAVTFVSLVKADNLSLGIYQWFKLAEFAGLFFYLQSNFRTLFTLEKTGLVLIWGGLFQAAVAIGQFALQKDLGLKFLAESPLGAEMDGVAKIVVQGSKMIRAYGTFPHPNVLAAFLFFALFAVYFLMFGPSRRYWVLTAGYGVLFLALSLTFSRTIIFAFIAASAICFVTHRTYWKRIIPIPLVWLLTVVPAWTEFFQRFRVSLVEQSVFLRSFYNQIAALAIKENPVLGLGMGNFVAYLRRMLDLMVSWAHQPVHNIYLLVASEVGLLGLAVFFMFLWWIIRIKTPLKIILFSFLFIGLFDHFFMTLQQGQLMFWLILGMISSYRCP